MDTQRASGSFTLSTEVPRPFDDVVLEVREALTEQGFGVLTEIDLAWTFKAKLDVDVPPQVILGACRPQLAYQAVTNEPSVAAMLPCNVVVRQVDEGHTVVEAFDPQAMVALGGAAVEDVARDAGERLTAVIERLSH